MPGIAASGEGVTLYGLAVELFGDMTRLKRDMAEAKTYSLKAGGQAGDSFALAFQSPMLSAIGGVRQVISSTTDALGIMSQVSGVAIAAKYQRLSMGFETLTGSSQRAKAIMADLIKMGDETPFHDDDLISYAQNLLALGVNAQKVTGDLSALADATAARGGNSSSLGELTNIVSGFRLRAHLDVREVGEIGRYMDLTKVVAAATGRSGLSELQAASVLANMRGDKAYDAIIEGAKKVYGGAAAGQGSNTVEGLGNNLQQSIALSMKPTGDMLLPMIGGIEKGLISAGNAAERFNAATGGAAGLAGVILGGVVVVRRFGSTATTTFSAVRGLTTAVTEFGLAADKAAMASRAAAVASGEKAGADATGAVVDGVAARAGGEAVARIGLGRGAAAAAETAEAAGAAATAARAGGIVALGLKAAGGLATIGIPIALDLGAHYVGSQMEHSKNREVRLASEGVKDMGTGISIGATVGAIVGSVVPVLGTALGAAIGGAGGGLIGAVVGRHNADMAEAEKAKQTADEKHTAAVDRNTQALQRFNVRILGGGAMANGTASALEAEYALANMA